MKNILGISFSPRSNGNCVRLANLALEECANIGHSVILEKASEHKILPCQECDYECFGEVLGHPLNAKCPIDDDVQYLWNKVENADSLLWAVPNFYGAPNALFMAFRERGQGYIRDQEHLMNIFKNKPFVAIIISNTPTDHVTPLVVDLCMFVEKVGILELAAKDYNRISLKGDLADCLEVKKKVKNLGRRLNKAIVAKLKKEDKKC